MNKKYYFTFGINPLFPYEGGHVCVLAETRGAAICKFNEHYPPRDGGLDNYAFSYDENEWEEQIAGKYPDMEVCHAVLL